MKNFICYLAIITFLVTSCSTDEGNNEVIDNSGNSSLQANPAPEARDCDATHSFIGQSRELSVSSLYGISGLVTIVSDCEIEISNFFYNGSGPNISVYAGLDGNYRDGVNLSVPLNGQSFEDATLNLFLPEGTTFDDVNSFSIWCFEFDVSFSSTSVFE